MRLFEHVARKCFQLESCPEVLKRHIQQAEKHLQEQKVFQEDELARQLHQQTFNLQQLTFELHHNPAFLQVVNEDFHDNCQEISENLEQKGSARSFTGFLEDCKARYWKSIVIGILGFTLFERDAQHQTTPVNADQAEETLA